MAENEDGESLSFDVWACRMPECGMVHLAFYVGKNPKPEFKCSLAPEDVEKFTKAIAHEADTILAQRARAAGQIN